MRRKGFRKVIIGLTGNSLEDELQEFSAAGTDLVMMKPAKIDTLDILIKFLQENSGFQSRLDEHMKLAFDNSTDRFYWSAEAYHNSIYRQTSSSNAINENTTTLGTSNRLKMFYHNKDKNA